VPSLRPLWPRCWSLWEQSHTGEHTPHTSAPCPTAATVQASSSSAFSEGCGSRAEQACSCLQRVQAALRLTRRSSRGFWKQLLDVAAFKLCSAAAPVTVAVLACPSTATPSTSSLHVW
jgi:hypothetical protein